MTKETHLLALCFHVVDGPCAGGRIGGTTRRHIKHWMKSRFSSRGKAVIVKIAGELSHDHNMMEEKMDGNMMGNQ